MRLALMPNEPCTRPVKSEQSAEGHGPVVRRIGRRRLAPRAAWQAQIDHPEKGVDNLSGVTWLRANSGTSLDQFRRHCQLNGRHPDFGTLCSSQCKYVNAFGVVWF